MSPQAIQSLIELFGVEKGLHIMNLFTAMDDTELAHQRHRYHPVQRRPQDVVQDLDLQAGSPAQVGQAAVPGQYITK